MMHNRYIKKSTHENINRVPVSTISYQLNT